MPVSLCIALPPTKYRHWVPLTLEAGKTVLTSLIIEECRKKKEEEGFDTSYFYCRGDDVQQNTSLAVLMDILRQMVQHNDDLIAYCNDKSIEGPLGSINVVGDGAATVRENQSGPSMQAEHVFGDGEVDLTLDATVRLGSIRIISPSEQG